MLTCMKNEIAKKFYEKGLSAFSGAALFCMYLKLGEPQFFKYFIRWFMIYDHFTDFDEYRFM